MDGSNRAFTKPVARPSHMDDRAGGTALPSVVPPARLAQSPIDANAKNPDGSLERIPAHGLLRTVNTNQGGTRCSDYPSGRRSGGLVVETFATSPTQSILAIYVPEQPTEMQPYLRVGVG